MSGWPGVNVVTVHPHWLLPTWLRRESGTAFGDRGVSEIGKVVANKEGEVKG
jgi:hypothetical protein